MKAKKISDGKGGVAWLDMVTSKNFKAQVVNSGGESERRERVCVCVLCLVIPLSIPYFLGPLIVNVM